MKQTEEIKAMIRGMMAQEMENFKEGFEGTFGQAIGSLKHGFLVRRKGWNGKGMFLFMRPWDSLKDGFIIDTVKSLPWSFKEWVRAHPNAEGERFFTQYICMKAADGSIVNGWPRRPTCSPRTGCWWTPTSKPTPPPTPQGCHGLAGIGKRTTNYHELFT